MSKYIKLEDAIHNINLEVTGRKEYTGDMKANLFFALDDLPTIEVNEDCISREWVKGICEYMLDEEMLGHMLGYIEDAPSIMPTVRKNRTTAEPQTYITEGRDTQILDAWQVHHRNITTVEDEPTTEQSSMVGEWIACTKEGLPLTELGRKERQKWYGYKCSKCNFIYKGNAITESPFCQNCGTKMRLE